MSDPIRDAVRSAITEMVADAPAPEGYDPHRSRTPSLRGPLIAVAAFAAVTVILGVTALVRPIAPDVSDQPTAAVDSVYVLPTWLPDGYLLWNLTRSFDSTSVSILALNPGPGTPIAPIEISSVLTEAPTQIDTYRSRLTEQFPEVTIDDIEVRGRAALAIDSAGFSRSPGWRAVVVLEGGLLVTEVFSRAAPIDDLVAVADGLTGSALGGVEAAVGESADWTFSVALPSDSESFDPAATPGVEDWLRLPRDPERPVLIPEPSASGTQFSFETVYVTVDGSVAQQTVVGSLPSDAMIGRSVGDRSERVRVIRDGLESGGLVLGTDPSVLQAPESPDPAFDPAVLGEEQPIRPYGDADELAGVFNRLDPVENGQPVSHVVGIGQIDNGIGYALLFVGERDYLPVIAFGGSTGRSAHPIDGEFSDGLLDLGTPDGHALGYAMSPQAAVVQYVGDDGATRLWQRPRLGFGVFSLPGEPSGELIAYAADGAELERKRLPGAP